MKKINYFLAGSAAALLLASAPMLASAHGVSASAKASAKADLHAQGGLGFIASIFHGDRDHDGDRSDGELEIKMKKKFMASSTHPTKGMHAAVGVVTAINGSTFTIDPVGNRASTTVSTNSTTVFRLNGNATTSSALEVGSRVALIGMPASSTGATSSPQASIEASVVSILNKGFGFFKHFFLRFSHH